LISVAELIKPGFVEADPDGMAVRYRLLDRADDLDLITRMLHAAYRQLAEAGMRYVASYHDVETTRRRADAGDTIVAVVNDQVVGTITLSAPGVGRGASHYLRADVAVFGQFGVDPAFQGRGIGSRLLSIAERMAQEKGAAEIALDTSEHATHLLAFYETRGFRAVEYVQWEVTNYRSVVLSKPLRP
jgi:GNAT superfamily N-acetyltransferase